MLASFSFYVFQQRKSKHSILAAVLCVLFLTACSGRPEVGALALNNEPAAGAKVNDVLIVTTRARDERPDTYFNGERSEAINYAEASISVPPTHKAGTIAWPKQAPGNPNKDFVTRNASYISDKANFTRKINQRLAALPKGKREILVFIHGYNTLFPEALYRFTQIVHDAQFEGVPVLFTWASRGNVQDYVYDLNSTAVARSALEATLIDLSRTNADSISILAHSMGNWLLMETAVQAAPHNRRALNRKIKDVFLAAPDIDVDVFKAQLRKLGKPPRPFKVIISRDDRALGVSRRLAGGKERLGAFSNDQELAELGAIVIYVTDLKSTDRTNHSKFAQLAQLEPEVREALGQLAVSSANDANRGGNLGQDIGSIVGSTAGAAIALPIKIISAPFSSP